MELALATAQKPFNASITLPGKPRYIVEIITRQPGTRAEVSVEGAAIELSARGASLLPTDIGLPTRGVEGSYFVHQRDARSEVVDLMVDAQGKNSARFFPRLAIPIRFRTELVRCRRRLLR